MAAIEKKHSNPHMEVAGKIKICVMHTENKNEFMNKI